MGQQPLRVGQTNIDHARSYMMSDGRKAISWCVRLPGSERAVQRRTSAKGTGVTVRELRRRAHEAADRMVAEAEAALAQSTERVWTGRDLMSEWLEGPGADYLWHVDQLKDSSRKRYDVSRRQLAEEAGDETIAAFMRPDRMRRLLVAHAEAHGTSSAKRAKTYLKSHVICHLVECEIIDTDPIAKAESSQSIGLPDVRKHPGREGRTVTPKERERVCHWLVAQDAWETRHRMGGQSPEAARYRRQELIDMTLVQATCGLRVSELRGLTVRDVLVSADGRVTIRLSPTSTKTDKGRYLPVFDPVWGDEVSRRLVERCRGLGPDDFVFGLAVTPGKPWGARNCNKNLRAFYDEIAEACSVPTLSEPYVLTHVWRASLSDEYRDVLPDDMASALLGHTEDVHKHWYTTPREADEAYHFLRTGKGARLLRVIREDAA